jgi:hypothetical protein
MTQLTLQLTGYPRPIAWTLSELDRSDGDRDHRDMLLTAFEDVTRYLTLVAIARYAEYFAAEKASDAVEGVLQGLRRPSFGHYVQAARALDQFLSEHNDPFALGLSRHETLPAAAKLCEATGSTKVKKINFVTLLSRVVEIRNRDKAHGFTGQEQARAARDLLEPALVEFLEHVPLLLKYPLVWIEHIEFVDKEHTTVTLLELMGTQRAARRTRDVQTPGDLQRNFMYMWNGESAPVQLTPFFHVERTGHDEVVYMLANLGSEPSYRAPGIPGARMPDPLLPQLSKRAPFLMTPDTAVTSSRAPDAEQRYRDLVDMALADGRVTVGEAKRLASHRAELGLSDAEATAIHEALGWNGVPTASVVAPDAVGVSVAREPTVDVALATTQAAVPKPSAGDWPQVGRVFAAAVRDAVRKSLRFEPELVLVDDDLEIGEGELWIQLQPSRGVSLWYPDTRKQLQRGVLQIVVGFYSQNQRRDPGYRAARDRIESEGKIGLPKGWSKLSADGTFIGSSLGLETSRTFALSALADDAVIGETSALLVAIAEAARAALQAAVETSADTTTLATAGAAVAHGVPEDFELAELGGDERIHGSIWIARLLWALEWARRHEPAPKTASELARILTDNGVHVQAPNAGRAFRTPHDDPRRTGLCEEPKAQRYVISASGRRALFELLSEG